MASRSKKANNILEEIQGIGFWGGQNSFSRGKRGRERGFSIYVLQNKEIRLNVDYKSRNLFMRVSQGFHCQ